MPCLPWPAVTRGEVEGTVEFTGSNTFFGKTASMLQGNDGLGNLQKILLKVGGRVGGWAGGWRDALICITVKHWLAGRLAAAGKSRLRSSPPPTHPRCPRP